MTCWQIRFCYLNLLKRHGLTDVSLAGMMVHSKDMSESLLIDSFRSAHLKAFDDDETRSQVNIAHKRFRKLLEERNRIVHGTWWLGEDVIVMADSSKTHGFKTVRRDAGVEYDPLPNLEESNALIGKTKKLRIAFTFFPRWGVTRMGSGNCRPDKLTTERNTRSPITAPI